MTNEDVRIVEGDCLDVLPTLETGSVDAVIADPPYSSGGMYRGDRVGFSTDEKYTVAECRGKRPNFAGDSLDQRAWASWCKAWLRESLRVTRPGGYLCCFTDWRQLPLLTDVIQHAGWIWRGVLAWDKTEAARQPHNGYFKYQAEFIVWGTKGPCAKRPPLAEGGETVWPGCFREPVRQSDKHHQTGKPTRVLQWLVKCAPPMASCWTRSLAAARRPWLACGRGGSVSASR